MARCRFRLFPVRSPLLRESHSVSFPPGTEMFQFPGCPPHRLWVQRWVTTLAVAGLPHSGIHGSTPVCGSPWLIAAYHALHRLLAPRHPPCALSSLPTQTHFRNGAPANGRSFRLGEPCCPIVKVHIQFGSVARWVFSQPWRSRETPTVEFHNLVEATGFEPVTPCVQSRCSPAELRPHAGGRDWIRTSDLTLIRGAL